MRQVLLPGQEHLQWQLILDTCCDTGFLDVPKTFASGEDVTLAERAACLLQLTRGAQTEDDQTGQGQPRQVGDPGGPGPELVVAKERNGQLGSRPGSGVTAPPAITGPSHRSGEARAVLIS